MSRTSPYILVLAISLLLGLAGCASRPYYSDIPEPVVVPEPGARSMPSATGAGTYVVKAGDTLHSIAFAAGTDWSTVARLNGIRAPYTIYPGQRLRLVTAREPAGSGGESAQRPPVQPSSVQPSVPASGETSQDRTRSQTRGAQQAPSATSVVVDHRPGAWHWPSRGRVLQGFASGPKPHKGIDIAGGVGDPVLAARDGTVVYAGSGVRGYGNLLIVKHDAHWLSAYAHNSRLLVAEGDVVRAGQRIAEMGDSATDRPKLHFEVRRQGNPVDPLQVLPGR